MQARGIILAMAVFAGVSLLEFSARPCHAGEDKTAAPRPMGTTAPLAVDGRVPVAVKFVQDGKNWQLLRNGKTYFIKGVGGGGSKSLLAQCGGNSFRTWGAGPETQSELDEAQQLGLTVTVGVWLGHKEHGFNYDDPQAVQKQFEEVQRAVLKYKDNPAVLMWGVGNEMENNNDTPAVWNAVQNIAKMIHAIDPSHPTMTVVAEIGGEKVQNIHKLCPDIDVIGVNTYGGGASLTERYRKAGGVRPLVITEFGPPGTWEIRMNSFGAAPELTSTEKARCYRDTYVKSVQAAPDLCLGSYAFTWGSKVEATATWFGMLLPDGTRLAPVDTMQELWSGKAPEFPCPGIKELKLTSKDMVARGETVTASVEAVDPKGGPVKIQWLLLEEQATYDVQGPGTSQAPAFPDAIERNGESQVKVKMPKAGGVYRLYCCVRNDHGGAAVGSLPIKVTGPVPLVKAAVAKLPLVVLADGQKNLPYSPSGWMGNTQAIKMDFDCTDQPHTGKTCLKASYNDSNGWGGVVWQHPANDWGEKAGGFNLEGGRATHFLGSRASGRGESEVWIRADRHRKKVPRQFQERTGSDADHRMERIQIRPERKGALANQERVCLDGFLARQAGCVLSRRRAVQIAVPATRTLCAYHNFHCGFNWAACWSSSSFIRPGGKLFPSCSIARTSDQSWTTWISSDSLPSFSACFRSSPASFGSA